MASDKAWDDMSRLLKQFSQMPDAGELNSVFQLLFSQGHSTKQPNKVVTRMSSQIRFQHALLVALQCIHFLSPTFLFYELSSTLTCTHIIFLSRIVHATTAIAKHSFDFQPLLEPFRTEVDWKGLGT